MRAVDNAVMEVSTLRASPTPACVSAVITPLPAGCGWELPLEGGIGSRSGPGPRASASLWPRTRSPPGPSSLRRPFPAGVPGRTPSWPGSKARQSWIFSGLSLRGGAAPRRHHGLSGAGRGRTGVVGPPIPRAVRPRPPPPPSRSSPHRGAAGCPSSELCQLDILQKNEEGARQPSSPGGRAAPPGGGRGARARARHAAGSDGAAAGGGPGARGVPRPLPGIVLRRRRIAFTPHTGGEGGCDGRGGHGRGRQGRGEGPAGRTSGPSGGVHRARAAPPTRGGECSRPPHRWEPRWRAR